MASITSHPDGTTKLSPNPFGISSGVTTRRAPVEWQSSPVTWQKCPKCDGEGKILLSEGTAINYIDCPVCDRKMIISLVDGKPPTD